MDETTTRAKTPTRLLLVEDRDDHARLLELQLARQAAPVELAPVELRRARSMAEMKAAVAAGDIDLVLLDLGLPDTYGMQTVEAAREAFGEVPIIVLTGLDAPQIATRALELGAQDYLVKEKIDPDAAFADWCECAATAVVGAQLWDLVDDGGELRRAFDAMSETETVTDLEIVRGAEGTERFYELALQALELPTGGRGALLMVHDVTERRKLQARMMEMDRMIAIGTLAAGVGHEINNPLTYVSANLEYALEALGDHIGLLEDGRAQMTEARRRRGKASAAEGAVGRALCRVGQALEQMAELREALVEAHEGAGRVRDIVKDLKRLSCGHDGEEPVQPVAVEPILESSINIAWNQIKHRARLVRDYSHEVDRVRGSASKLGQVFLNLLINAAQAIPDGQPQDDNEVRVALHQDGEDVVVVVSDTGCGMEPEVRRRLFDPFFTTKQDLRGTGLGLAISQNIVEALGGRIEVDSEPGVGSTFRVVLPSAQTKVADSESSVTPVARLDERVRVLVVDDEPAIGRIFERMLRQQCAVTTTTSVDDARRLIVAAEADYEVIFCDLLIPRVGGAEMYAWVEEHRPWLARRLVFMTGGAFTEETRRFQGIVDNLCLAKPLDFEQVAEHITALVGAASLDDDTSSVSSLS